MFAYRTFICDENGEVRIKLGYPELDRKKAELEQREAVRKEIEERCEQIEKAEKLPLTGVIWGGPLMLIGFFLMLVGSENWVGVGGFCVLLGLGITVAIRLIVPFFIGPVGRDYALDKLTREYMWHHGINKLLGL